MRIVWWNCCQGFDRDLPQLREIGPDVALLAEVPQARPPDSLLDAAPSWHWSGDVPSKGLAIAGFDQETVEVMPGDGTGRWSQLAVLPAIDLGLLAIWSCPDRPTVARYAAEVRDSVAAIPTYFHYRRRDAAFHIDFMFCSDALLDSIENFEVGTYERWVQHEPEAAGLSDHVPLVLDLSVG